MRHLAILDSAEPQPWGHIRTILGTVTEVTPADAVYTTNLAIEPAGDASPSMQDYGRFLQLHLRGLRGRDDVLKAATIQELHGSGGQDLRNAVARVALRIATRVAAAEKAD